MPQFIRSFAILFMLVTSSRLPAQVFPAYERLYPDRKLESSEKGIWYDHLHGLANNYLDSRDSWVRASQSLPQWEARKKSLKTRFQAAIGGLPPKTPLNPQILETLNQGSYTVEKLLYQSLPGLYVSAALFLPKERQTPAPAVIYCSGHTREGFRSPTYQRVILSLVAKGFIVLAFDPIGQGERYQYLDESGKPDIGGPTKEHSYAGLQCLIAGRSIARYMIHDGMQAVDYLYSRPEVDRNRIGITGRSGGGTQSSYIAAFDERIKAVAPENYITNFRRLWETIGPQDAEQNFLAGNMLEIDHGDLLSIRIPKPGLMLTTKNDFFSLEGAQETYQEVETLYELYGAAENWGMTESPGKHESTQQNREALYAFFQKHLELPGSPKDQEVDALTEEQLTLGEKGQVGLDVNSKSIPQVLREELTYPTYSLEDLARKDSLRELVQGISGFSPDEPMKEALFVGEESLNGQLVQKFVLEYPSERYSIPYYLLKPKKDAPKGLVLYLHEQGKDYVFTQDATVKKYLTEGYWVCIPDLLNLGELSVGSFSGDSQIDGVSFNLVWGSSLVGKSLPIFQAEDLYGLMQVLPQQMPEQKEVPFMAHAVGQPCVALGHYLLWDEVLDEVIMENSLVSWRNLLETDRYKAEFAYSVVPGALPRYDLPVLWAFGTPRKLEIRNPLNARGEPVEKPNEAYELLSRFYQHQEKGELFSIGSN